MRVSITIFSVFLAGCGTLNTARPLAPNEHRMGITGGGVVLTQLGPPIPLPNMVIEGQSGFKAIGNHNWDINYGLNATALAFGTIGTHLGSSILLKEANGLRPALSMTERMHFYNNWLDSTKAKEVRKGYLLNEIELTASWNLNQHLGYVGMANYTDTADPEMTLAPFIGTQININQPWYQNGFLQLEMRYLAINRQPDIVDVSFLGGNYGALSVTGSIGKSFGKGVQQ